MERIEPQVVNGPVGTAATILRDRWGIAHISADEPYDLGVGLGYAVARERLWQLDYMRRRVRGELAAVMGPEALANDREMLTVGIAAAADSVAQTISGPTATLLAGVAAGINAWRRTAIETAALPEEFGILDYQPAPWTPADSVALWRWRWWMLTGRLEPVALIEAARRTLPSDLLAAFLEVEAGEETIVPGPAGGAPGPIPGGDASGEGSNNWAVAGSRTTTGFPVLCSDPHNTFDQPSQWFQAQLTCPAIGLDSIGAVYVGTASAYIGRNRHTAWGVTNHVAPIRDLYIEETDAPGGDRYRDGTTWRPFETERHTIKVRGAPDETLIVRRTVRGPIVNDLLPWTPTAAGGAAAPISLRWCGLEDGVESGLEAMLAINCARNADETLAALERWPGPVLNYVFADRAGRIGYHVASHIPRREIALRGLRPANDPDHAWQGILPFDRL
ncbi:MAG: penicillin acylase family protein, partial [Chloroflexota bacterium]|nr:penicillin acylase family protein [Chloroflexota bacterium]